MAEDKKKSTKEERLKRANIVKQLIQKKHQNGEELVLIGNEVRNIATDSTGSSSLDKALGGGYARGRIVEIYGQEASGKTTLTLHAIAEQQKAGKLCAFVDVEQALDSRYAKRIGVNMEELLIIQPEYGEQAGQIVMDLVNSGEVGCVVVDSVAAMVPKKEIDGELEDNNMGLQARMMSKLMRTLTPVAAKNGVTVIFINQLREKIGVMFGNPNATTGGNALKYYASQRISMLSGTKVTDSKTGELKGGTLKCRIAKNKIAAPGNTVEIPVVAGQGIDTVADVLELAKQVFKEVKSPEEGPFKVSGGHHWFYGAKLDDGTELKDGKLAGSGADAVKTLKENPKMLKALRKITMDTLEKQRSQG
tara:strand:- start:23115 stop:24203 length:1089 start_codon:yes stop_codon:yes gene_type:complete